MKPESSPPTSISRKLYSVLDADGRADPETDPKLDLALARRIYEAMVRTRLIDARMLKLQRQGRVGFHVGCEGEEAAVIASAAALRDHDWIFPCYREVGAALYRGFSLQTYLDNMYGNANDVVKGRQMPDHVSARGVCFGSISSPIGTQITQAVGFAWAAKLKRESVATAVYFGDGATSSNDFHAGMNFAGVYQVPTLFLLRNNGWAISVPADQQTHSRTYADKGIAYGIPAVRCDGNDALAVYAVTRSAVERAARGEGPTLIELVTYRVGARSTSD
ncbi:MAG TPA: thiamine pyrophosphate-dependent enzyme, partial [Polyangiales bacterium]|nr:thiamine pyrophosphate-dependent enzyme [Polyangiales bacterium]